MLDFVKRKPSVLDEPIDRILNRMEAIDPYSDEYATLVGDLERLIRLQNEERSNRVSPDTLAIVLGNLLGIVIIVGYEKFHVVGSRALNFVIRTKHK